MQTGRPVEYDLDEVLQAATEVFWRCGYQAASLSDLLRATALSKSSLYHTFGSKHELFLRCLERYHGSTTAHLQRRLQSAKSGRQFITNTLVWIIEEEARSVEAPRGCLVVNTATEMAQSDSEIADRVTRSLNSYHAIFRQALERDRKEDAIGEIRDVDCLADYFVTNMSGLRTMVKAGTSTGSLKKMVTIIMQVLD